MLIIAGMLLGVISAFIELSLVRSMPWLLNLIIKVRFLPLGLVFSLMLSIMLGYAFSAVGLTAMIAGAASTVMTQPYYEYKRREGEVKKRLRGSTIGKVVTYTRQTWAKK